MAALETVFTSKWFTFHVRTTLGREPDDEPEPDTEPEVHEVTSIQMGFQPNPDNDEQEDDDDY